MDEEFPPEIDAQIGYAFWPADKPFPLTPLEAWYVMCGHAVRPKSRRNVDVVLEMPGQIEMANGYVLLRHT